MFLELMFEDGLIVVIIVSGCGFGLVMRAVGLGREARAAAEVKVRLARIAFWPAALVRLELAHGRRVVQNKGIEGRELGGAFSLEWLRLAGWRAAGLGSGGAAAALPLSVGAGGGTKGACR